MRKVILVFSFLLLSQFGFSQMDGLSIRVSNNTTGLPIASSPALFYTSFNPGVDLGLSYRLNQNTKHIWSVSGNLGVFYHRFIQTGIKLYPSIDYGYQLSEHWQLQASFDLGYMLAINNAAVAELQDDGYYEAKTIYQMRSQFMFGLRFGAEYSPSGQEGIGYTAALGAFMQGPYVSGYVPLLPYNTFQLGVTLPIQSKKQGND